MKDIHPGWRNWSLILSSLGRQWPALYAAVLLLQSGLWYLCSDVCCAIGMCWLNSCWPKVGELNKEFQAFQTMMNKKTEEHGNMVINLEKIRLHTEQQVKTKGIYLLAGYQANLFILALKGIMSIMWYWTLNILNRRQFFIIVKHRIKAMIALSFVELFFGFAGTETMYFLQNIVVEFSLQSHGYVKICSLCCCSMLSGCSVCLLLQKCVAQDMVRDLEATGLELESYLDGQVCPSICYPFVCVWRHDSCMWGEPLQVSLQLQLLQLQSDLQHEQVIAATWIKERDRAVKRMKWRFKLTISILNFLCTNRRRR